MANSKEYFLNLELMKILVPGDIVEFPRACYKHYGIFVGNGGVIHVLPGEKSLIVCGKTLSCLSKSSSDINEKLFVKGTVIKQNLLDIAENTEAKKNNYLDGDHSPLSPTKIVKNAKSRLNKRWKYHLIKNNCEHFATWCRYGLGISKQTNSIYVNSFPPSVEEAIPDTSDSM